MKLEDKKEEEKVAVENKKKKKKEEEDEEHRDWIVFEKQLAVFLGEFDATVQIADEENRFLTTPEIETLEQKLLHIWEEHITKTGKTQHLKLFKNCYKCKNRNTHSEGQDDMLMTLGVIRCGNTKCDKKQAFTEMFNTVYTKRDIDRAREHMEELLKTGENPIEGDGLDMVKNTETLEKNTQREKEAKNMMYQ